MPSKLKNLRQIISDSKNGHETIGYVVASARTGRGDSFNTVTLALTKDELTAIMIDRERKLSCTQH